MMLVAIARPNAALGCDGLIGCWRVCEETPCQRGNKKTGRKAGDLMRTDCKMDANKFESMMRADVIPAIRHKFKGAKTVTIQYDNASPHKTKAKKGEKLMTERLADVLKQRTGPKIEVVSQVAQSPDTNACDLGFFRSMDSRLPAIRSFDLDKFEQQCLTAFREFSPEKLTGLFDAKQRVCKCILESASVPGQNDYKLTRGNRQ